MSSNIYTNLLFKSLYNPVDSFRDLSQVDPAPLQILLRYSIWLLLLPPFFAWIGASNFGWRLGAEEPLRLPADALLVISIGYLLVLLFGLVSTAFISRWMASTYGANKSLGRHLALVTMV